MSHCRLRKVTEIVRRSPVNSDFGKVTQRQVWAQVEEMSSGSDTETESDSGRGADSDTETDLGSDREKVPGSGSE